MPILPSTLDHRLSSLSTSATDENNEIKSNKQPVAEVAVISDADADAGADVDSSDESSQGSSLHEVAEVSSPGPRLQKTESKIKEEQGLMADEPLLKENPHRFVIFPIQDNEVRQKVETGARYTMNHHYQKSLLQRLQHCRFLTHRLTLSLFPCGFFFLAVSFSKNSVVGNVQESRGIFLDFRGD